MKLTIVAEIGTSHNGSIAKACRLIDIAKEAGAQVAKFQWVYAKEILHPLAGLVELPGGKIPLYDRFRSLELDSSFYARVKEYAHSKGLLFCCSPFGLESLKRLIDIAPDIIKIASPELNHYPLLKALASARSNMASPIPIVLSSGVSTLGDIQKALDIVGTKGVTLLHCISSYPAPAAQYNLNVLQYLKGIFGVDVGVSDHSTDPVLVPVLALASGATMIEKHITQDKASAGLDDPIALDHIEFTQMCQALRQANTLIEYHNTDTIANIDNAISLTKLGSNQGIPPKARREILRQLELQYPLDVIKATLGTGVKALAPSERANYQRTNRSLHYMRSLRKGHKIAAGDCLPLRTEKVLSPGISPEYIELLLGKTLTRDIEDGQGVQLEDFMLS